MIVSVALWIRYKVLSDNRQRRSLLSLQDTGTCENSFESSDTNVIRGEVVRRKGWRMEQFSKLMTLLLRKEHDLYDE